TKSARQLVIRNRAVLIGLEGREDLRGFVRRCLVCIPPVVVVMMMAPGATRTTIRRRGRCAILGSLSKCSFGNARGRSASKSGEHPVGIFGCTAGIFDCRFQFRLTDGAVAIGVQAGERLADRIGALLT